MVVLLFAAMFCPGTVLSSDSLMVEGEEILFLVPFDGTVDPTVAVGGAEVRAEGGLTFDEGKYDGGADLAAGAVGYAAEGNLHPESGTLSFWLKPSFDAGTSTGILRIGSSGVPRIQIWKGESGVIYAGYFGSEEKKFITSNTLPDGFDYSAWHHIALRWRGNGDTYSLTLWVDGNQGSPLDDVPIEMDKVLSGRLQFFRAGVVDDVCVTREGRSEGKILEEIERNGPWPVPEGWAPAAGVGGGENAMLVDTQEAGMGIAVPGIRGELRVSDREPDEKLVSAWSKNDKAKVRFDPDGVPVVAGKRTILFGTFRDPSDKMDRFEGILEAGMNLTHYYGFGKLGEDGVDGWIEKVRGYLRAAHENGLGVFLHLPIRGGLLETPDWEASLREIVLAVKDEPALWFWYLFDEPAIPIAKTRENGDPPAAEALSSVFERAYKIIRENDADHPVVIVDALKRLENVPEVSRFTDGIWLDHYRLPYTTLDFFRTIDETRELFPGKPVLAVPHGGDRFNWFLADAMAKNPLLKGQTQDDRVSPVKPQHLRAELHAVLAGGSPGLVYYWNPHYRGNIRKTRELWKQVINNGKELKRLEPVLLSREKPPAIKISNNKWGYTLFGDMHFGASEAVKEFASSHSTLAFWVRQFEGHAYIGLVADRFSPQRPDIIFPENISKIHFITPGGEEIPVVTREENGKLAFDGRQFPFAVYELDERKIGIAMNDSEVAVLKVRLEEPNTTASIDPARGTHRVPQIALQTARVSDATSRP